MAFEADCGSSTVLVCSAWRALPGPPGAETLHDSLMRSWSSLWCRRLACMCGRDGRTTRIIRMCSRPSTFAVARRLWGPGGRCWAGEFHAGCE